jgi:hypothetical protein
VIGKRVTKKQIAELLCVRDLNRSCIFLLTTTFLSNLLTLANPHKNISLKVELIPSFWYPFLRR